MGSNHPIEQHVGTYQASTEVPPDTLGEFGPTSGCKRLPKFWMQLENHPIPFQAPEQGQRCSEHSGSQIPSAGAFYGN